MDTVPIIQDTLVIQNDSIAFDSTSVTNTKKESPIDSPVTYNSKDSMDISIQDKKLFLYGDAKVTYQNIELTADYIEFDMANNVVLASAMQKSDTSKPGKPVFTQGSETFTSDTIQYNFKTKKGIIKHIVTEQGDGFLHANLTKRHTNGHVHIKGGKYTTCNLDHPHFYIGLTKAISTEKNIVSGPAYFVMEDIPLPAIIPFGFFPSSKNRTAGILIPTYGESRLMGFYLQNGGLYIPINDYVDVAIQGDIYTRGTWGLIGKTNYNWKYHFRGGFEGKVYFRRINDDFNSTPINEYSIRWNHSQDAKANPTRTFSANVNITSSTYGKNISHNYEDLQRSGGTQNSNISYSKKFGDLFYLTTAFNYNQNNIDSTVDVTLPDMSFSLMQPIYPFRSKNLSGKPKWFENIQIGYNAQLKNQIINAKSDSSFFTEKTLKNMKNGFYHTIPISLTGFKLFNLINVTPSLSYSGALYGSRIEKRLPPGALFGGNLQDSLIIDTIRGLNYAHALTPSVGFSISPKFYGMFQSTKTTSYVQAIRHVITPSVGFSYAPNMRKLMNDYTQKVSYSQSVTEPYQDEEYSIYTDRYSTNLFPVNVSSGGYPPINIGLGNTLEMKVLSKKDTTGKAVKVPILSNFRLGTSYDPNRDTVRWSNISMGGSTSLFKNKVNINFSGTFSPYAANKNGLAYNKSYFADAGKLLRLTNFNFSVGMNFASGAGSKDTKEATKTNNTVDYDNNSFDAGYVDFDIPWSFTVNYTFGLNNTFRNFEKETTINQNLMMSGNVSLTKKWKIGGNTGFDFDKKEFITTQITISRDLHCWEMSFSVVPFGIYRNYSFRINATGSILRDLKWDKKRNWYDYY